MVAVLLRLRFRVLGNSLRRNPAQLIAVIVGGMLGAGLLAVALGALLFTSTALPIAAQTVVVFGGSALVLGWMLLPLVFDGVDRTLEPVKLARFPVTTTQLMTAMFLVGLAWVPGVTTVLGSIGTALAWREYPVSALVAVITGLLGAATCIVGSRLTTSVAGMLLRGRGASRIVTAVLVLLVIAGPFALARLGEAKVRGSDLLEGFGSVATVLGWTPFGAVWSIPGRIAMGDSAGVLGASAIAIGTLVGLLLLWRLALGANLRVRGEAPVRAVAGGRLGALGWFPSSPTGAVAARTFIYWFRDARQARQLILIPVLPALMLTLWGLIRIDALAFAAGPFVASLLPLAVFAGLSYDGTAFAAELAAGVRGRHDRLGRAIALLAIAGPSVIVVQVTVALIIGRPGDLPALLGISLGTLLVSIGVVSVSSAWIVVPVTRAGRNPFAAQPGAATVSIVGSYVVSGATVALVLPVIALGVAALATGIPLLGWLALAAALVLGFGIAWAGVVIGGRVLDRTGSSVLARLRVIRA
ncbi:transporter [Glaciihabitans arcticus]|uniref:Transporter n=1 Tax=Glaciihabitans arcticus TaxID=2668039 RepID=A0A4Q9GZU3_9MICO|nr:transporter [Glaciihabitans arcticus]TBN58363.1 transporter [Glaciihabitans arcticus]